jgi:hypothetical protein
MQLSCLVGPCPVRSQPAGKKAGDASDVGSQVPRSTACGSQPRPSVHRCAVALWMPKGSVARRRHCLCQRDPARYRRSVESWSLTPWARAATKILFFPGGISYSYSGRQVPRLDKGIRRGEVVAATRDCRDEQGIYQILLLRWRLCSEWRNLVSRGTRAELTRSLQARGSLTERASRSVDVQVPPSQM